jgi:hypothetical protein
MEYDSSYRITVREGYLFTERGGNSEWRDRVYAGRATLPHTHTVGHYETELNIKTKRARW